MRAISTTSAVFEDLVISSGVAAEIVIEAGGGEAALLLRRNIRTLYYSAAFLMVVSSLWKWRRSAFSALCAVKGLTSKSSACSEGDGPRWIRSPSAAYPFTPEAAARAPLLALTDNDRARWTELRQEISWDSVSEHLAGTRLVNASRPC